MGPQLRPDRLATLVCLLVALASQQHASVSQGRIYSDNCTCCHTEIEVADPTFYLTQSHYTDTGPTGPSAETLQRQAAGRAGTGVPILSHWYDSTRKNPSQAGFELRTFRFRGGRLNHLTNEAVGHSSKPRSAALSGSSSPSSHRH